MVKDSTCMVSNSGIWDDYYKQYQSDVLVPGVKYPNEYLVTFIMDWKNGPYWDSSKRPKVLELGFGNVTNMKMMADKGCDVLGLEVSDDSVQRTGKAIENMGMQDHLSVGNYMGPEIPCEDNQFDAVVGLQCVYYNVDQKKFADECARVLKPGGLLFLSFFSPRSGYMNYIEGEAGGVVKFREDHHNPRLSGLQLFLYRDEQQFEETYGRHFNVEVGKIETDLNPDFHSWFYLRGQKKDVPAGREMTFEVSKPENGQIPELAEADPENAGAMLEGNKKSWDDLLASVPEAKPFGGNQYPSERFLCFMATRNRRHSEHYFASAIGKEDAFSHVDNLRALELNFQNPVMHEAMIRFGYEPHGVSYSPVAVQRGNESVKHMGLEGKVDLQAWDGVKLPYDDAYFDLVGSIKAAYYQPNQRQFIEEVSRVVRPGGEIFFYYMTPRMSYQAWMEQVDGNVYRYTDEHPSKALRGMHVFFAGQEDIEKLWSPYFETQVKYVDFSAYKLFSSFYVVTGLRK